jgi:hypothetical protein
VSGGEARAELDRINQEILLSQLEQRSLSAAAEEATRRLDLAHRGVKLAEQHDRAQRAAEIAKRLDGKGKLLDRLAVALVKTLDDVERSLAEARWLGADVPGGRRVTLASAYAWRTLADRSSLLRSAELEAPIMAHRKDFSGNLAAWLRRLSDWSARASGDVLLPGGGTRIGQIPPNRIGLKIPEADGPDPVSESAVEAVSADAAERAEPDELEAILAASERPQRFAIRLPDGAGYDVVEGEKLTELLLLRSDAEALAGGAPDRFLWDMGGNRFTVVAGAKVNAEPLDRAAATQLAEAV